MSKLTKILIFVGILIVVSSMKIHFSYTSDDKPSQDGVQDSYLVIKNTHIHYSYDPHTGLCFARDWYRVMTYVPCSALRKNKKFVFQK